MPWKRSAPLETHSNKEKNDLLREMWDRPKFSSFTWTPPAVAANTSQSFLLAASGGDITSSAATGLRTGNPVHVSPPSALPNQVSLYALVTANDTITVVIVNPTGAPVTPPAGSWGFHGVVI